MTWCQRHLAGPRYIGRDKCRHRVWSNDNVCYKVLHEAGRFWQVSALIVFTILRQESFQIGNLQR